MSDYVRLKMNKPISIVVSPEDRNKLWDTIENAPQGPVLALVELFKDETETAAPAPERPRGSARIYRGWPKNAAAVD
jgi:hypothetical protein